MKLTFAQKQDKWRKIIAALVDGTLTPQDAIDRLTAIENVGKQDPFYEFIRKLDHDYAAIKAAQGNTPDMRRALDSLIDHVMAYAQSIGDDK